MSYRVAVRHPRSGEVRRLKVGWSWVLFFFAGLLGLPLFLRGLHALGAVMLTVWAVNSVVTPLVYGTDLALYHSAIVTLGYVGLQLWLGWRGNELTAKSHLERGWEFAELDAPETQRAKAVWGLS